MKRLALALALGLWVSSAQAQNVTCSTRPAGDSSNACASTAFVTGAIAAIPGGGGGGVTSIQGMTGALTCGANMTCSGGIINSTGAGGGMTALASGHIYVGNASNVAVDQGPSVSIATTGQATFLTSAVSGGTDFWNVITNGNVAPLNNQSIGWQMQSLARTVSFGLSNTSGIFTDKGLINSNVDFLINVTVARAIIFSQNGGEVGRWKEDFPGELDIGPGPTSNGGKLKLKNISGAALIQLQNNPGTPTLTMPTSSGTFAVTAGGGLTLDAVTGNMTCTGCVLTSTGSTLVVNQTFSGTNLEINLAHDNTWPSIQTINTIITGSLHLPLITSPLGNFQCLHVDSAGVASGTGADCGAAPGSITITSPSNTLTIGPLPAATVDLNLAHANTWTALQTHNAGTLALAGVGAAPAFQCLHAAATTGVVSVTGTDCGSSGGGAVNSVSNADGTLTIAPTAGAVVASLNLAHANTWTANQDIIFSQNALVGSTALNSNTGTSASAGFAANNGTNGISMQMTGTAYNAVPILGPARGIIYAGSTPIVISTGSAQPIIFGIAQTEISRFTATGLGIQPGGQGVAPDAPLTINGNTTATAVAPAATTYLHAIAANNAIARMTLDAFGGNIGWILSPRFARGTAAAPTAVQANDIMFIIGAAGLTSGGIYSGSSPQINFNALENWTTTANGGSITISMAPVGSVNALIPMIITASGIGIQTSAGGAVILPDAPLAVNSNTVAMTIKPPSAGMIHLTGKDNDWPFITIDSFGTGHWSGIAGSHANGTAAVPTQAIAGEKLLEFRSYGYTNAGAYGVGPAIAYITAESYTATAQGSLIDFQIIPIGTVAVQSSMRLQASGGLSVGSANIATDGGAGGLVASNVILNATVDSLLSLNKTSLAVNTYNYISFKELGANYAAIGLNSGSTAANPVFFVGRYPGGVFTQSFSLDNNGLTATLINAASANTVCYNSASQILSYTSGTCTVSALSAKNLIAPLSPREGYDIVMAEEPWRYTLKPNLPTYSPGEQIGLVADYADKIDPRLVTHNADGSISGFRYEQYTAALTAAFKYLKVDNDNLRSELDELKRKNR